MSNRFCPHCMHALSEAAVFCPYCGRNTNDYSSQDGCLPVGSILQGTQGHQYVFGKSIGGGGFGITYVAKDQSTNEVVAIKEYFPRLCQPWRQTDGSLVMDGTKSKSYQSGLQSFMSEATMLQAVSGVPSVVQVLDYFEKNGTAYMVMEFLEGFTLREKLERQSRFEPTMLFQKMIPLMRDLQILHDAGVIHRDLAPDNIMLMPSGSLKIMDFGCARSLEDGKSMEVMLKPGFAPIEQYGSHGQGAYTDIYALCATIYYCLVGEVPAESTSRASAVTTGAPDPLVRPTQKGVMIPAEVENVILWGMSIRKEDRPQRLDQLVEILEPIYPTGGEQATPAAQPAQPTPQPQAQQYQPQPQPQPAPQPQPVPQQQYQQQPAQQPVPQQQYQPQPQPQDQQPANTGEDDGNQSKIVKIVIVVVVIIVIILLLQ